jgi:SAM-dependent methyltransferase
MLEHVEEDDTALAEAYRLLAPGGLLLVSVPAHPWLWGSHDISLHHKRRYRRDELVSKLIGAGFELERCTFAVSLLAPLAVVYRLAGRFFGRSRPAHSEAMELPAAINKLLIWIMRLERALLLRWNLPVGISLLCLAHKPELSDKSS